MSLLLAGMTVLVLDDSYMTQHSLISTLPDDLIQQGVKVYSYGACGMPSGEGMKKSRPSCSSAYRLDRGSIRNRVGVAALTPPRPILVKKLHPDLLVVVNGDDMAGYKSASIPKAWIWKKIATLTKGIKESGVTCVWVGHLGGVKGAIWQDIHGCQSDVRLPRWYCLSLCICKFSKDVQAGRMAVRRWGALFDTGYQTWADVITREIVMSDLIKK